MTTLMNPRQSIAFLLAVMAVWLFACSGHSSPSVAGTDFRVELHPIELDPDEPERIAFERLELLAAFQLRSNDSRFGGLSGLTVAGDGNLYAVSDRGFWLSARMHMHSDGRLLKLTDWQIALLLTTAKKPVQGSLTDAEGLAQAPDGSFLVSFEQAHRIWRYPGPSGGLAMAAVPVAPPSEITKAPPNGGLEAVSVLPDGRIFAITEQLENNDGSFKAWLLRGEHWDELSYVSLPGFHPSDAVALKTGDVLVLERRHNLPLRFSARLALVKARDIRAGSVLRGEEIVRLEPSLKTDNFEGIAVKETAYGTMIFLVSDDNYFPFQRTLLLQFLLPHSGQPAR